MTEALGADRHAGALLAGHNETWQERKYLDMDDFRERAAARAVENHLSLERIEENLQQILDLTNRPRQA